MTTTTDSTDVGLPAEHAAANAHTMPWYRRFDRCGLAFILISLVAGAAFAIITPPFWGADEGTHFSRAYQIDHGGITPEPVPSPPGLQSYGGKVPATVNALRAYANHDISVSPGAPAPRAHDPAKYRQLAAGSLQAPLEDAAFSNTSAYSPLAYIPSVVGLRVTELAHGTLGDAITAMRLLDLLTYTGIVWAALWAVRTHAFKWVVFVTALLPMALSDGAMITADAVTDALAILFSVLFVKSTFLRTRLTRSQTALLCLSGLLLPVAKPTYVILTLLLLVVPPANLALRRYGRVLTAATTGLALAAFSVWTSISAKTSAGMGLMRPQPEWHSIRPSDQIHYVLTHIPHFLRVIAQTLFYNGRYYFSGFFGNLSFGYIQIPAIALVACLAAGALAFGQAGRFGATRPRLVLTILVVLASVAAIFGALYLEFSPVGYYMIDGVQGRYFVPLTVVAAAILAQLIPLRLHVPTQRIKHRSAGAIVVLMGVALATSLIKYDYVLWH